jgi:hypothetical protein
MLLPRQQSAESTYIYDKYQYDLDEWKDQDRNVRLAHSLLQTAVESCLRASKTADTLVRTVPRDTWKEIRLRISHPMPLFRSAPSRTHTSRLRPGESFMYNN